jgi:hypothetical protein
VNRLEKWLLKRLFAKAVKQGSHQILVPMLYKMIRVAWEDEFTEENLPTIDANLREHFESTQFRKTEPIS